jgi:hypothetical protein
MISDVSTRSKARPEGAEVPTSHEAFGYYRTILERLATPVGGLPTTLGVTSCKAGDGVSTVSTNLALVAAAAPLHEAAARIVFPVWVNCRNPPRAATAASRTARPV